MQIPEHLQHFPSATLIVAADGHEAKFYLAGGDAIEELDGVAAPAEMMSDNETSDSSPDSEMKDEERKKHLVKLMAERMKEVSNGQEVEKIYLVMPAEIRHAFEKELGPEMVGKIDKRLDKDLAHQGPIEILEALFA